MNFETDQGKQMRRENRSAGGKPWVLGLEKTVQPNPSRLLAGEWNPLLPQPSLLRSLSDRRHARLFVPTRCVTS